MIRAAVALLLALGIGGVIPPTAGAASPAAAAGSAPPPVAYVELLRAARDALPADPVTAARDVDQAASLRPDAGAAALDPVRSALAGGDAGRARALLDDEVAALALPPGAAPGSTSEARRRLDAVYSRAPLDELDRPHGRSFLGSLLDAALRGLGWLTDHLGTGGALLLGLLVLLAAAALAAILLRRVAGRRPPPGAERPAVAQDPDAEWTAALDAAGRGDNREAVRRAFRSALLSVATRGHLVVDAAWTNRELLARLEGAADLVAAVAPAAAGFEVAWYGGRPVSSADWTLARRRCEAVRSLAGRPGAAAGTSTTA